MCEGDDDPPRFATVAPNVGLEFLELWAKEELKKFFGELNFVI